MMAGYLGIDTSNYTTSLAIYDSGIILQEKRLLPVREGQLGLRQSDAVFSHIKAIGGLSHALMERYLGDIKAVGVSQTPRNEPGSYMPCFLSGVSAAQMTASVMRLPIYYFSHQQGHIAAALYGADKLVLFHSQFVALHVSGGTTECLLVEDLPLGRISILSSGNDLHAGQVVDRVGKMLGCGFPAGREIDSLAASSQRRFAVKPTIRNGNPCLSGVENQCARMLQDGADPRDVARFCIDSILAAVREMAKTACRRTGCKTVLFAGGVMSNSIIQREMSGEFEGYFSPAVYSSDNAAGIALLTADRCNEQLLRTR